MTSQQQTYHTSSQKPEYTRENHRPVTSQQQTYHTSSQKTRPVTSQQKPYHTSSQKTTDLQQVNNKLITPHHRKLQTSDKSTTNLSHLITENYRPVTSQQQTYHTLSQKTTDL